MTYEEVRAFVERVSYKPGWSFGTLNHGGNGAIVERKCPALHHTRAVDILDDPLVVADPGREELRCGDVSGDPARSGVRPSWHLRLLSWRTEGTGVEGYVGLSGRQKLDHRVLRPETGIAAPLPKKVRNLMSGNPDT